MNTGDSIHAAANTAKELRFWNELVAAPAAIDQRNQLP